MIAIRRECIAKALQKNPVRLLFGLMILMREKDAAYLAVSQEFGQVVKVESFDIWQYGDHQLPLRMHQIVEAPTTLVDVDENLIKMLWSSFFIYLLDYFCGMLSVTFMPDGYPTEAVNMSKNPSIGRQMRKDD